MRNPKPRLRRRPPSPPAATPAPTYVEDKDSGELRRPHHIDFKTGKYRGRQVLKPKAGLAEKASEPYSAGGPIVDVISPDRRPNVPAVRATPGALADLNRHGYSDEEIWALVVPKRTLARRVARREPLTVEETDRALRLERIAVLADRVFGNPEKAHRWMRKSKHLLGGRTPVDFLATEAGARQVEEMLYRIAHGIFM